MTAAHSLRRQFANAKNKLEGFGEQLADAGAWTFAEVSRYLEKHSALHTIAKVAQYQHVHHANFQHQLVVLQPNGTTTTFAVRDNKAYPTNKKVKTNVYFNSLA
jgi:hypothetical protein